MLIIAAAAVVMVVCNLRVLITLLRTGWTWLFSSTAPGSPKPIEEIGFLIGVVTLILGFIAFRDLKKNLNGLSSIAESLSTKHRSFSSSVEKIKDLVSKEYISTLRVMVDVADYGHYSVSDKPGIIQQRIKELAETKGADVKVLVYTGKLSREKLTAFLTDERFRSFLNGDKNYCKSVLDQLGLSSQPTPTLDEFLDRLHKRAKNAAQFLQDGNVKLRCRDSDLPLYCWIRDEKEAVFAIPLYYPNPGPRPTSDSAADKPAENLVPESHFGITQRGAISSRSDPSYVFGPGRRLRGREISFSTHDHQLIKALEGLFDRLYNVGTEC